MNASAFINYQTLVALKVRGNGDTLRRNILLLPSGLIFLFIFLLKLTLFKELFYFL
jgi:hypothetical protein